MKNITRFSLALMMFTLLSISYLVTSALAEEAPSMAPPGSTPPPGGMAPPGSTPPPGGMAPPGSTPPPGDMAPPGGTPPPGGVAPKTGDPAPSGGVAPKTGDPAPSGGLTGWIRGLLGDKPKKDMASPGGMAPPAGQ